MTISKTCTMCGNAKPLECYSPHQTARDRLNPRCKPCNSVVALAWAARTRREDPVGRWAARCVAGAKHRARVAGVAFAITSSLVASAAPTHCPVLGIALDYTGTARAGRGFADNTASLDRVRPELGYVPGNVVVVSMLANAIKRNASPAQLAAVAAFYQDLELHPSTDRQTQP